MKKKSSKSEAQIEAAQETEGFTTSDFIKVEKNLTSLGFFTPSTHKIRTPQAKEVSFTRTHEGKREKVSVTIAPSVLSSLPTTADQDKYLAFQKIITDRRQDGEAIKNPISFTSAELLRSLDRRVDAGKNYNDIESWLDRMTSTTVISKARSSSPVGRVGQRIDFTSSSARSPSGRSSPMVRWLIRTTFGSPSGS